MNIRLNGEPFSYDGSPTVAGLIGELRLEPRKVAIERNLEIVPKSLYGETPIADGDRIEIVQFVGGG
ncbi:MAG: sulfur carrier protein ThiS [Pseudomonadota bacterium]